MGGGGGGRRGVIDGGVGLLHHCQISHKQSHLCRCYVNTYYQGEGGGVGGVADR